MFKSCVRGIFLIFFWNDVVYCTWTLFGWYFSIVYDITLTLVVFHELCHFTNWYNILFEPLLVKVIIIFMMSRLSQSFCVNSIILRIDLTCFICRHISNIFGHAQICTNFCFVPNSSSSKGGYFCVSFISSKDIRWGRAHMVYLFSR